MLEIRPSSRVWWWRDEGEGGGWGGGVFQAVFKEAVPEKTRAIIGKGPPRGKGTPLYFLLQREKSKTAVNRYNFGFMAGGRGWIFNYNHIPPLPSILLTSNPSLRAEDLHFSYKKKIVSSSIRTYPHSFAWFSERDGINLSRSGPSGLN